MTTKRSKYGKTRRRVIGCGAVAEEYVKAFKKDDRSEIRALTGFVQNLPDFN